MDIDSVMSAAGRVAGAAGQAAALPTHRRAAILRAVAEALRSRRDEWARLICKEVGKPLKEARREADRAAFVFEWAAAEVQRFGGEWMPLDLDAAGEGRLAMVRRFPRGPCLFITPFNFPLNLAAHKVAPAVAVGAPFLLKPPPQAPECSQRLAEVLVSAGWPEEAVAITPCDNEAAEALVKDERFAVLSFTGSAKVGWHLKSIAGRKHVALELGGNAGAVVAEDGDLALAAARCAWGGFYYSGQVCVSVQRIFVEESVYEPFKELFLKNVSELVVGDPSDENTDVAPLIDEAAASRVESWIEEARAGGGKVLTGGKRRGSLITPAVVEAPPGDCRLCREEVFGPVVTLEKVGAVEVALNRISASPYGLHAGIFTRDMETVLSAWSRLQVGGLIINDIPAYRSDAMPYGGTKASGIGREGVKYAMEEYTETRTLGAAVMSPRTNPEWLEAARIFGVGLATTDSTPGGGAAAAASGAFGMALARMSAGISAQSKKTTQEHSDQLAAITAEFGRRQRAFIEFALKDAEAFDKVMDVYSLPKTAEGRREKLDAALADAAKVPLEVVELVLDGMQVLETARPLIVGSVGSDVNCAVHLLRAAGLCALENVEVNAALIKDAESAHGLRRKAEVARRALSG